MTKRCVIVGAGSLDPKVIPEKAALEYWIACDGGMRYLEAVSVRPDFFVGDLDSFPDPPDAPSKLLPVRKDDTDVVYACRYALSLGYREFLILGGLGGDRFSHSVANVQLLTWLKDQGADGTLLDERTKVRLLRNETAAFTGDGHRFFSLFALHSNATVSIKGALFPLENADLSPEFPLGVSNEFAGEAIVTVAGSDVLLVIDG